jgi:hypothetical protein
MKFPVEIDGDAYFLMIEQIKKKCDSWKLPDDMNVTMAQIDKVLLAFDELYCDQDESTETDNTLEVV